MKKMMMFSFTMAMSLAGINSAYAQNVPSASQRVDKRIESLDKSLNLSKEQEDKLRQIFVDYAQKEKAEKDALRQNRKNMDAQMKSILTADQYSKLQDMRKERQGKHMEQRAEEKSLYMKEKLGLDDKQSAAVHDALIRHFQNMSGIRENTSAGQDAMKSQLKDEKKRFHEDMKGILTPDQMKKLKEIMKDNGKRQ